jgi:hypothetical protein
MSSQPDSKELKVPADESQSSDSEAKSLNCSEGKSKFTKNEGVESLGLLCCFGLEDIAVSKCCSCHIRS